MHFIIRIKVTLLLMFISFVSFGQNNNCINATPIIIPSNGFGLGTYTSSQSDITNATIEAGETFPLGIVQAGQIQKSVWYKFSIPTHRAIKVTLAQNGSAIQAGDVGFSVYATNSCLPTSAQISTKLTPLGVFGSSFHLCTDPGDYLIQVSGKSSANGPVYISLDIADTTFAPYNKAANAYQFPTLAAPNYRRFIDYAVDCHTIESSTEICSSLSNYQEYTKSTWHTFTTPPYFDYVGIYLAGNGSTPYFRGFPNLKESIGYNLYSGDARITTLSSLVLVHGCDSFLTDGQTAAKKLFKCSSLQPNTTYSIQLFFKKDFKNTIRLAVAFDGTGPTQAPQPVSSLMSASNKLGVLASGGAITTAFDHLGCNARHSLHPCNPSLPVPGFNYGGVNYNLSTFFTFTLANTAKLSLLAHNAGSPSRVINSSNFILRLYKQDVTNSCNGLDPVNQIGPVYPINAQNVFDCMDPGTYTVQIMGTDTISPATPINYIYLAASLVDNVFEEFTDLGKKIQLSITVLDRQAINKYNLQSNGAFDSINVVSGVMQPLIDGVTYTSKIDTFGCSNTVRPFDTTCAPGNNKVIYRQFVVQDSGVVSLLQSAYLYNKLYKGDANALAMSQNAHVFPERITGLTPYMACAPAGECDGQKVCLVPGTYTHALFGSDTPGNNTIGVTSQPSYRFNIVNTTFGTPQTAENLGTLNPGGTIVSSEDYFSCKDNAVSINGYTPCSIQGMAATKAIYRQFYLGGPSTLYIRDDQITPCGFYYGSIMTLFKGKITDGLAGLTPERTQFRCFTQANTDGSCDIFEPGWYTLVSYGSGPSYSNPFQNIQQNGYGSFVTRRSRVTISATVTCASSKFNRPHKAALDSTTGQPFLIQWGPRTGHTAATPKTDTTYGLYSENFNCSIDTPFLSHIMPNCANNLVKATYYVFRTTQESFVQIDTKMTWGVVYKGNARTDSATFSNATLIQTCNSHTGHIQLCRLQPGDYTLVIFGTTSEFCTTFAPELYIDRVGYSSFDHASKAYDFGLIPADSVAHYGSDDIIYCTTGSQTSDPTESACYTAYNSQIYAPGTNIPMYNGTTSTGSPPNIPRRNLWYTFQVNKGGNVHVNVQNKTIGKTTQHAFAIYKSNVDGTLPFTSVVNSGQVDSTMAQGLTFIKGNPGPWFCFNRTNTVSFYRDPCNAVQERYYIVVDLTNSYPFAYPGEKPNSQVEVSILFDSVNAIQPKFDHYYQASNIGNNLGSGTYTGQTDNYSCATGDLTDPTYYYTGCNKSLWYKFSTNVTGQLQYRTKTNNIYDTHITIVQLFRASIPGDSTVTGLQIQNTGGATVYDPLTASYWAQSCIYPGTYYILLPGCNYATQFTTPEIKIIENAGDFCATPVNVPLSGAGNIVSTVLIDCHTIGTDYGEFNPTLSCPSGAPKNNYKTSWFRINITGTDTLDITTFLSENTSAQASDIKYRLMNGNCGAMQERSCVQDAQTQDTYKCLSPGEYFVQVFTPVGAVGSVNLNISAIPHADPCAPPPPCLVNAIFQTQFDCNASDSARFINNSTYGSAIQYLWNFGYAGQTSTAVAPGFKYPESPVAQTYTVTLSVVNSSCAAPNTSNASGQITIPGRPAVYLGRDTTICGVGSNLVLNASTWTGSTYQWQNGSTGSTFTVTASGTYHVKVTYNGCVKRDTILVNINTITPLNQQKTICNGDSVLLSSTRNMSETYLWNTGSTGSSIFASTPGIYTNNVGWKGCVIKDSFRVSTPVMPFAVIDTTVCSPLQPFSLQANNAGATAYLWQNNSTGATYTVTTPGQYWVRVSFPNCFITDTIQVNASAAVLTTNQNPKICAGQSYTLPWGPVITTSGIYRDTVRYASGCDSLRRTVNIAVQTATSTTANAGICAGQSYILPWGTVVNSAGIYKDTLRYASGCDSIRRTVNLSVAVAVATSTNVSICTGQSYTLANGIVVNTTGVYNDTLRYTGGCDSLRRTVNLTVQNFTTTPLNANICFGQSYTLPWGIVVNSAGVYRDTLRYTTRCDSVRRSVTLTVQAATSTIANAGICAGQSYTLPWGTVVNTAGVYRDTLRYSSGCDSIRRTVNLSVAVAVVTSTNASICIGQSYTLPNGIVVNTSGIYRDTLRYTGGCDSLRRSVNLTVQNFTTTSLNANICSGQSYTLPWGSIVNTAGIYRDTLRYSTGCDSVRRSVILTVQSSSTTNTNASICAGQNYTLPWGTIVNAAGVYKDTLRYISGCDSLMRIVNLSVQTAVVTSTSASICSGQTYTLANGIVVSSSGVYADTLRFASGCDSVRRTLILTVQTPTASVLNASICPGQNYTLPWGAIVNTAGIYRDTLRYVTGCDSLRRTVNLVIQTSTSIITNPIICTGQTYTLPWGTIINTAGTYRDTLRYTTGCDSVRLTVNVSVQAATSTTGSALICAGQTYTLPWGTVVNSAGVYRDTLRYSSTGCDSVRRAVNLAVQTSLTSTINAVICAGQNYTLPSGLVVISAGGYKDTVRYSTGCDSLQRVVNLTVTAAALNITAATICSDKFYTLPWGAIINTAGNYRDTIRTAANCDSLIRQVNLTVNTAPTLVVTKANDVNCIVSTSRLNVTGAGSYTWSPSSTLSSISVSNPLASPVTTTTYTVTGTAANGCIAKDSIRVNVVPGNPENGYLVPSAFTPNNDGVNDCFGVPHWGDVSDFNLTLYNRFGQIVFKTNNVVNCWDGLYKGRSQNNGAYVYVITANGICGPVMRKGVVMLVR